MLKSQSFFSIKVGTLSWHVDLHADILWWSPARWQRDWCTPRSDLFTFCTPFQKMTCTVFVVQRELGHARPLQTACWFRQDVGIDAWPLVLFFFHKTSDFFLAGRVWKRARHGIFRVVRSVEWCRKNTWIQPTWNPWHMGRYILRRAPEVGGRSASKCDVENWTVVRRHCEF